MPHKKSPDRAAPEARTGTTPPSVSDEQMEGAVHGKLFADDGRKVRDTERVGAMSPDADPSEHGATAHEEPDAPVDEEPAPLDEEPAHPPHR
ncbi:MAG TPA: hypothetical protein VK932_05150 [Kofleriaceae bacterium]|nr:hypothetical protein [Kofleriaceae bacterium]